MWGNPDIITDAMVREVMLSAPTCQTARILLDSRSNLFPNGQTWDVKNPPSPSWRSSGPTRSGAPYGRRTTQVFQLLPMTKVSRHDLFKLLASANTILPPHLVAQGTPCHDEQKHPLRSRLLQPNPSDEKSPSSKANSPPSPPAATTPTPPPGNPSATSATSPSPAPTPA